MSRSTALSLLGALLTCVLLADASPASPRSPFWGDLEPGPYRVSLVVAHARDDERLTRAWSPDDDRNTRRGRPLRVYMWYPISKLHKDPPMTLREYVHVDATDTHGQPMTEAERREYETRFISRGEQFGADTTGIRTRLGLPTMTLYQALAERGEFPTVLVAPGLDHPKPFDHVVLCEYLASHGYYVASLPFQSARTSAGAPAEFLPDLYHQVRDLEWLIAHMRERRYTDRHRFGIVGHGTGSLAALLLQARNPDVRALVLLDPPFDGTDGNVAGDGGVDVRSLLERDPLFDSERLATPILSVRPVGANTGDDVEADDLWGPLQSFDRAPRVTLTLPGFEAADLTSLGALFSTATTETTRPQDSKDAASLGVVERVHAFLDASLRPDPGAVDAALRDFPESTAQAQGLPEGVSVFLLPPGNSPGEDP